MQNSKEDKKITVLDALGATPIFLMMIGFCAAIVLLLLKILMVLAYFLDLI